MHKKKIKVNPVDQVLQVLIYLIIISLSDHSAPLSERGGVGI